MAVRDKLFCPVASVRYSGVDCINDLQFQAHIQSAVAPLHQQRLLQRICTLLCHAVETIRDIFILPGHDAK